VPTAQVGVAETGVVPDAGNSGISPDRFPSIIQRGLSGILNYEGRDSRAQFALFVSFVWTLFLLMSASMFIDDAFEIAVRYEQAHDAYLSDDYNTGGYDDALREARDTEKKKAVVLGVQAFIIGFILPLILTASSIARRLRDAGISGKWLFLIIPATLILLWGLSIFVFLIVIGFLRSDPDINRFGPPA
jgi:uncharacterized membrane protein YhaH (DUF805 family)